VPAWAAGAFVAWGGAVTALHVLAARVGADGSPCLVHRAFGIPCPACGGTRCVVAAASGDPARAFLANPLVFAGLAVSLALLLVRAVAARRLVVDVGPAGRRAAPWVLVAAAAAGWCWQLARAG
jgi:hypothetical protein